MKDEIGYSHHSKLRPCPFDRCSPQGLCLCDDGWMTGSRSPYQYALEELSLEDLFPGGSVMPNAVEATCSYSLLESVYISYTSLDSRPETFNSFLPCLWILWIVCLVETCRDTEGNSSFGDEQLWFLDSMEYRACCRCCISGIPGIIQRY